MLRSSHTTAAGGCDAAACTRVRVESGGTALSRPESVMPTARSQTVVHRVQADGTACNIRRSSPISLWKISSIIELAQVRRASTLLGSESPPGSIAPRPDYSRRGLHGMCPDPIVPAFAFSSTNVASNSVSRPARDGELPRLIYRPPPTTPIRAAPPGFPWPRTCR